MPLMSPVLDWGRAHREGKIFMGSWSQTSRTRPRPGLDWTNFRPIDVEQPQAPEITAQMRRLCIELGVLEIKLSTFDASARVGDHYVSQHAGGGLHVRETRKRPSADAAPDEVDVLKKALEAERAARQFAEERAAMAEARIAEFRQWGAAINALRSELSTPELSAGN